MDRIKDPLSFCLNLQDFSLRIVLIGSDAIQIPTFVLTLLNKLSACLDDSFIHLGTDDFDIIGGCNSSRTFVTSSRRTYYAWDKRSSFQGNGDIFIYSLSMSHDPNIEPHRSRHKKLKDSHARHSVEKCRESTKNIQNLHKVYTSTVTSKSQNQTPNSRSGI